jgi:signal transduction histidine kinase
VEGWRLTKAGDWIPVLLTFSLLPETDGGLGGIATIAKDLTQQKRLEEQLRAAAAEATVAEERERRKLAIDLHDGVGQLLGLTSMKLGALRTSVAGLGLVAEVREIERVVVEVQQRASSLVFQLSPPILHDVGLVAATHWLAEDMKERFGLGVTVEDEGERHSLDDTTRITLFRAVSELLTNVAKHAGTSEAHVHLGWRNGTITISVEDQGVGFDPAAPISGYGLFSIGERLSHLGGSAHVDSAPGKGTRILLTVPFSFLDAEDERELL